MQVCALCSSRARFEIQTFVAPTNPKLEANNHPVTQSRHNGNRLLGFAGAGVGCHDAGSPAKRIIVHTYGAGGKRARAKVNGPVIDRSRSPQYRRTVLLNEHKRY